MLRRRMADPGKDMIRYKIKKQHGKLLFRPQQKQLKNNIIPFPSSIITYKNEQKKNGNKTHKPELTACAEEYPIPVETRPETRLKYNMEN